MAGSRFPQVSRKQLPIMLKSPGSIQVQNLADLAEVCKAAGAIASAVIYSSNKVVVFYNDPQSDGIREGDFVDQLHIRHQKNARILIAVFLENSL